MTNLELTTTHLCNGWTPIDGRFSKCVHQNQLNVMLTWVLRFAKAWLHLRQRNAARYSPLCGERQRNAGCQAAYTVTNEHSQGPQTTREGQGQHRPHSQTSLSTSNCDIIPISSGQCWFVQAWLSKYWVLCWRAPDCPSQKLPEIRYKMPCQMRVSWSVE